jgi:hypothetical protein
MQFRLQDGGKGTDARRPYPNVKPKTVELGAVHLRCLMRFVWQSKLANSRLAGFAFRSCQELALWFRRDGGETVPHGQPHPPNVGRFVREYMDTACEAGPE